MLDLALIRRSPELVRESVARRRLDPDRASVDRFLALDVQVRELQARRDTLRHEQGELSERIKAASKEERPVLVDSVRGVKAEMVEAEERRKVIEAERDEIWRLLPNLLGEDVPEGATDEEAVEVRRWGEPAAFQFTPRDHVELGRITDTIDFERAGKVTGASFYYLKHEAALLEGALVAYALGRLVAEGFVPMVTPELARDEILGGIGFQPRGPETQVYSIEGTDLSLIGTAEITLGGYHKDEIFEADALPLRYVGVSRCFRTEAGAHGKVSKGLYRVHEFTKAEMFVICRPEDSTRWHDRILELEEAILQGLGIPYRVVNVPAGDLGAPAAKKYDIEAWMPGRGAYGEVTSCSNCTDYQARRLGVRYRPAPGEKPRAVHMLNGTAVAVSRTLIAILENYQREDGSVALPEAICGLCGGVEVIPARAPA